MQFPPFLQLASSRASSVVALVSSALVAGMLAVTGCSGASTPGTPAPAVEPTADAGSGGEVDAAPTPAEDAAPADKCGAAPAKSGCSLESSWVRGIAHFDPAHFKAGAKPILRVVLRHGFVLVNGEEKIGGRLHAWASIPITDPSKGEIPFAIDMCDLGTAMWSEENGAFHLVLIVDEDGNNDIDKANSNEEAILAGTASVTELTKMVDVDVSCHGTSACLDVNVDCTGTACTTITPLESCKKKTPRCESDSTFCN